MPVGKVYLIGAGPGDPGLITVRGARLLGLADVVLYDALAHPALLQHARAGAELRSVGKRYGEHSFSQDAINAELVQLARAGQVVARLKGGDPMLFARGAEEVEALAKAGIPFEIVPGITSSIGAAAYAGISLTHRDLSSSVAFITGTESPGKERTAHDWSKLATATQTLCVIMGMKRLGEITSALIAHGRDPRTPAAVVHWGTWSRQQVVEGTVADIGERVERAGVANPSVVIIGEVARLRDQMRWFDKKPLFAKRVLITRPAEQADKTADDVRERGAEPVVAPAITIVPCADTARFVRALGELGSYDMVAFTSANGVSATMAELRKLGRDARAFGAARIAAIGPGTAHALVGFGLYADVVAKEFVGEALAASVIDALGHEGRQRVLLLRAQVARDVFPELLRNAGVAVDVVAAYAAHPAEPAAVSALASELAAGRIEVVTFTASSTVRETCAALGPSAAALLSKATVGAIGPVTAQTARDLGVRVDVVAATYTVAGLLDALEVHFEAQRGAAAAASEAAV